VIFNKARYCGIQQSEILWYSTKCDIVVFTKWDICGIQHSGTLWYSSGMLWYSQSGILWYSLSGICGIYKWDIVVFIKWGIMVVFKLNIVVATHVFQYVCKHEQLGSSTYKQVVCRFDIAWVQWYSNWDVFEVFIYLYYQTEHFSWISRCLCFALGTHRYIYIP
jgi:hypothetical protein